MISRRRLRSGTRQSGADDERDEEQECERQDEGQREDALPEHGPDAGPHSAGRGWPDLPDEVQRRLELAKDCGRTNEQRDQANDGCERALLRVRCSKNAGHEFAASRAD